MSVILNVLTVLVSVYQGLLVTFFAHTYLGGKRKAGYIESGGLWAGLMSAFAVILLHWLADFELLYMAIFAVTVLLYAAIKLEGSALKKLFTCEFSAVILLIPTALVNTVASAALADGAQEAMSGSWELITLLASQAVIFIAAYGALKLLKKSSLQGSYLSKAEWALICVILATSLVIGILLNALAFAPEELKSRIYSILVFVGVIMVNVVTCYLVIDLGKKNYAVKENEMLKLAQAYSRQYVENATAEYDVIRKLRHDFKNNFLVISTLLNEGNYEEAKELAKSHIDLLAGTEIFVDTKNEVIDAVVNAKMSEAKSFGIDCTCLSVMDIDGIDDLDLCRLLANMLENAVSACVKCRSENKQINLKITFDGYNYTFSLKNTIDGSVLVDNPTLLTTKLRHGEHGYGIRIIRDIASKYSGRCDFYEEDKMFCCTVVLRRR